MTDFDNPQKSKKKKRVLRPYYISPEQSISRQKGLDHRTDIWSLGAVLFEVLTLHRPFEGQTIEDVLRQVNAGNPFQNKNILKGVPADLIAICQKALTKNRDNRYDSMADFAEDCRNFLDSMPLGLEHENFFVLAKKYISRHPGRAVAALLLLVGAPLFVSQQYDLHLFQNQISRMELAKQLARGGPSPEISGATKKGDLWLLAIGVSDYENDSLDLGAPAKDATDIVEAFEKQTGGSKRLYSNFHKMLLLNKEVTKEKLQEIRYDWLPQAKPRDTIVVFVAGHGTRDNRGNYFFLDSSTDFDNPRRGIERSDLDLTVTSEDIKAERRLLMYDTCAAGVSTKSERGADGFQIMSETEIVHTVDRSLGGIYILAASRDIGFAREDPNKNGFFTEGFLKGLQGEADENRDQVITIEELKEYVSEFVHDKTQGSQTVNTPLSKAGENFPIGIVPQN